jgi:hypothetical protein
MAESKSKTKSKSTSTAKPKSDEDVAREESAALHAEELAASQRPASTDLPAHVDKGEWPVPPGTKNPPNEKVDGKDVTKLDQGLDDFSIVQLDGAKAVLRLGKEERLVDQASLHNAAKKIAKAVQNTY